MATKNQSLPHNRKPKQAITDAPADEDGATRAMTDIPADEDGATRAMPDYAADDDGGTRAMPDYAADDDGGTRAMPDYAADDDGGTRAMPDYAADEVESATQPSPVYRTEDDGATRPSIEMTEERDGATQNFAPSQTTKKTEPAPGKKPPVDVTKSGTIIIGQLLQNRYRLTNLLGKGGFGAAYLAEDVRLKRLCVVKQMLIPRGHSRKQIEQLQANFEHEANLLAALNHPGHPNIPEIYDYFPDETGNYLVMKYIEGQDLKEVIKKTADTLPWRETIHYIVAVCDALDYMHTHGQTPVMHRDIKPSNVLLGDDGRLWLVDFGLATAGGGVTEASGSPGYTPLEQWLGEAVPTSDIYATGVMLHYMITGIDPIKAFGGKLTISKIKNQHGKLPPLETIEQLDDSIPKELGGIMATATAADPAERPTAEQLKQQLELLVSSGHNAALFTFKNGQATLTVDQLVDLCEENRQEAQAYLYKGDFERWFTLINRNDLAEAAVQAVKQYPDKERAGLERFLKLARPGLFRRRLWKATQNVGRVAAIFMVALLLIGGLAIVGGSYGSQLLLRWGIGTYPWSFYTLKMEEPNNFDEAYLTENLRLLTDELIDQARVDVEPPDKVTLEGQLVGYQISIPLSLRLVDEKPHFEFARQNHWFELFITNNITQGINSGITDAFQEAPVDITTLTVTNKAITFAITESQRAPWLTPTPGPPPTLTPLPTPPPTPTPEGPALIVIYNQLGRDIVLEIEGETWNILANDKEVIERLPGHYNYTVRYRENGQLAARGNKSWEVKAYRWFIDVASLEDSAETN